MQDVRGLTSIIGGAVLLAVAGWIYGSSGVGATMIGFAVAAVFLFYRGWQGQSLTEAGDFSTAIDLVTDPRGAVVDLATDQAAQWLDDLRQPNPEEEPAFDADAALARYLANRPAPETAPAQPPLRREFGRKGL